MALLALEKTLQQRSHLLSPEVWFVFVCVCVVGLGALWCSPGAPGGIFAVRLNLLMIGARRRRYSCALTLKEVGVIETFS